MIEFKNINRLRVLDSILVDAYSSSAKAGGSTSLPILFSKLMGNYLTSDCCTSNNAPFCIGVFTCIAQPEGQVLYGTGSGISSDEFFTRSNPNTSGDGSTKILAIPNDTKTITFSVGNNTSPTTVGGVLSSTTSTNIENLFFVGDGSSLGFTDNITISGIKDLNTNFFSGSISYQDSTFGNVTTVQGFNTGLHSSFVLDNNGVFIARTNDITHEYQAYNIQGNKIGYKPSTSLQFWFPLTDGSNGQVWATDGSGNISWRTVTGGVSVPLNLVPFGTGSGITSSNFFNYDESHGPLLTVFDNTGGAGGVVTGAIVLNNFDPAHTGAVTIQSVSGINTQYTLTLPPNAGTSGYVLQTDGTGITTWVPVGGGSTLEQVLTAGNTAIDKDIFINNATNGVFQTSIATFKVVLGDINSAGGGGSIGSQIVVDPDLNGIELVGNNGIYISGNVGVYMANLRVDNIGTPRQYQLPNADGTLVLSVNGQAATTLGNIVVDKSGSATFNGVALQTTFTVSHSAGFTPSQVFITPSNATTSILYYVDNKTVTTFDVHFLTAPTVGTNNVKFDWLVKP